MMIDVKTKKVQRRTPEQVGAILNQIKWFLIIIVKLDCINLAIHKLYIEFLLIYIDRGNCIKVDNIYNSYLNQNDENNHSLRWLAHDRIEHSRTESRSCGQSCTQNLQSQPWGSSIKTMGNYSSRLCWTTCQIHVILWYSANSLKFLPRSIMVC